LEKGLVIYSEGKKEFLKIAIIIGAILNLLALTNSFYLICAMVTSLQLAIHLPIMQFIFPSNVMIYLNNMVPVVMFDVLENSAWYMRIF
jgi:hypothetical protein